jgi:membrane-associated progesterone receptor component
MSFEPKTKVELDPPKDDVISLDYLSKCDGELDSSQGHTCWSDSSVTGTNPDYPTYVAIKGTIFDVTGNKAYGPEGSYKGKSGMTALLARQAQLNQFAYSFRRQGCLSRARTVISQA